MITPLAMWARLRGTYWFVPSLVTLASITLGLLLVTIDRRYPDASFLAPWAFSGGADGARGLLSAVAGSMITVVSVTFSVTIVALTVSSQHFGPRLLSSFMRDTAAQLVLGTFIGTFAYCMIVLRTVQGEGDGYARFVPHLSVTAALILTLISVGTLIYYVHHVSSSLQVSEITAAVTRDLEAAIDRLYPDGAGRTPPDHEPPPPIPATAATVAALVSGYLQEVDADRLVKLAGEAGATIWMQVTPGDFITERQTIAAVAPAPADADAFASRVHALLVLGNDRTSRQDAGFAVQQLVEVALHALSPGMNEPFTAITCIDRLGQGLSRLAGRPMPNPARLDSIGCVRLVTSPQTLERMLREACEPIRRYAGQNVAIHERLLQALATVGRAACRRADRLAVREEARSVHQAALAHVDARGRARLDDRLGAVLDAVGNPDGDA